MKMADEKTNPKTNSNVELNDPLIKDTDITEDITNWRSDCEMVEVSELYTQKSEKDTSGSSQELNSGCTVDAIHPRFKRKKQSQFIPKSVASSTYEYYCRTCDKYIDNISDLGSHFRSRNHQFSVSCVYCQGPVYKYFYHSEEFDLHECRVDRVTRQNSSSSDNNEISSNHTVNRGLSVTSSSSLSQSDDNVQ